MKLDAIIESCSILETSAFLKVLIHISYVK